MPMLTNLADVVRTSGLPVQEQPGWRTRGHGGLSGVRKIMLHHTAGPAAGNYPSLGTVQNGRAGLKGPLAQIGLARDGTVIVIAAGIAWHAGSGAGFGLPRNAANAWTIGIEAESTGRGDWTPAQLDAYPRLVAALCRGYGLSGGDVIAHKEWAAGRKIDPAGWPGDMAAFRAKVAGILGGTVVVNNPVTAPAPAGDPVLQKGSTGTAVKTVQAFLGGLVVDGVFGDATRNAVVAYQRALGLTPDGIVGAQTWGAIKAGRRAGSAPKPASPRNAAQTVATQRALQGAAPDGYWGDDTEMRVNLVRAALNGQFPGANGRGGVQGVKDAQWIVWAGADGVWGPKSRAALVATVKKLQAAWGTGADGIWGPATEAAWVAARARNYKTW